MLLLLLAGTGVGAAAAPTPAPTLPPRRVVLARRRSTAYVVPPDVPASRPVLWSIQVPPPVRRVRTPVRHSTAVVVPVELPASRPVLWALQIPGPSRRVRIPARRAFDVPTVVDTATWQAPNTARPRAARAPIVRPRAIVPAFDFTVAAAPAVFAPPLPLRRSRPTLSPRPRATVVPVEIVESRPVLWTLQSVRPRPVKPTPQRPRAFLAGLVVVPPVVPVVFAPVLPGRRVRSSVQRGRAFVVPPDLPASRPILWALQVPTRRNAPSVPRRHLVPVTPVPRREQGFTLPRRPARCATLRRLIGTAWVVDTGAPPVVPIVTSAPSLWREPGPSRWTEPAASVWREPIPGRWIEPDPELWREPTPSRGGA